MNRTIHVNAGIPYDVIIEKGSLENCGKLIKEVLPKSERAVIVSDSNVAPLYADKVKASLEAEGYKVFVHVFPAGEENKRLTAIEGMYAAMADAELSRSDFAVALGGGVTGDMCGFAAATYLRGIKFVQIPTTVLSQNDSSVGGKTGVDLECGKNLVGSFWQPCRVIADVNTLDTLPTHYVVDGFGEIIKHGCIKSAELFELIEKHGTDMNMIEELTARSIEIKSGVVERDERESGERMLLNFGHTLGHAIEKCSNFTKYSHGEAVGIGMLMIARAGEAASMTQFGTADRIEAVLKKCNMPTSCEFSIEEICEAAMLDKKRRGDFMNIVLLKSIGDSFTYKIKCSALCDFIRNGIQICKFSGGALNGTVNIPPSKSAAHRAILCAALADGRSTLSPIELSNDMYATIGAIKALGAKADFNSGVLTIDGIGGALDNEAKEPVEINCIESGSTVRFIIPIASAVGINGKFTGEGSLLTRPLGLYSELLPQAGVECQSNNGCLPLVCKGRLKSGEYKIRGDISSQFITGMLLALPLCEGDSKIILTTELQSSAYVDMTVCCMADFGVKVERTDYGWSIKGGQHYQSREYTVEGDWSQAGFFLCAGALGSELTLRGLRMDSVQGDMAAVELFLNFGADITEKNGNLIVRKGSLKAQHINAEQIPDLVPCLAVCAALCEGTTIIDHAERLHIKESDRLVSTAQLINALGGKAEAMSDGLKIEGVSSFTGGKVNGFNDHRTVMSTAIAALAASGEVSVTHPFSINKSYPSFFDVYNSLGGNANVINLG